MTAKDYLREIRKIDLLIDQKITEYDALRSGRSYVGGMDYAKDRVQTSPEGTGFARLSDKLTDLQREIDREIDEWSDTRHERINQIQRLARPEYVDILFRRYVKYQSFESISSELRYSYNYVCNLHGEALREFEKKVLN